MICSILQTAVVGGGEGLWPKLNGCLLTLMPQSELETPVTGTECFQCILWACLLLPFLVGGLSGAVHER